MGSKGDYSEVELRPCWLPPCTTRRLSESPARPTGLVKVVRIVRLELPCSV